MKTKLPQVGKAPKKRKMEVTEKTYKCLAQPIKSVNDTKDYSYIQLKNGLRALLISDTPNLIAMTEEEVAEIVLMANEDENDDEEESEDEIEDNDNEIEDESDEKAKEEKLAACALCVGAGSFSDPLHIQGLAHFLEHMVFMGSEKYPDENAFDSFIRSHGGNDNASTESEYTTFYFEIDDPHLYKGMDIFAQFFISPLMKREAMTREREAVESEFQMAVPVTEFIKQQLLAEIASEDNPVGKFMMGNLETLKENIDDDVLYSALHEFRAKYYTAPRMTLAVQGRFPLVFLERWVDEIFGAIPSEPGDPVAYPALEKPFKSECYQSIYFATPVKGDDELNICFFLPSLIREFRTKPADYLAFIIGHEGKGSLLSYLRKRLWAYALKAHYSDDGTVINSLYTIFTITICLTEEGYKAYENVIQSVFSYLSMMHLHCPEDRIYNEMKMMQEIEFRYVQEIDPAEYTEDLSENMQIYPPEEILTGPELYFEYDPQKILELLQLLIPSNANVLILSKKVPNDHEMTRTEKWFKIPYTVKPMMPELISRLQNAKPHEDFHLPLRNIYIPTNLSLTKVPLNQKYPEKILETSFFILYFKEDGKFTRPCSYMNFQLINPELYESPGNWVIFDLYLALLKQLLTEETYSASAARIYYSMGMSEQGFVLSLNGYNENLEKLLDKVLEHIKKFKVNVTQELFTEMKKVVQREYVNFALSPYKLAKDIRIKILREQFWTSVDKLNALTSITFSDLLEFSELFCSRSYVKCLVQGHLSKEDAIRACEKVTNALVREYVPPEDRPEIRVHNLEEKHVFCRAMSFSHRNLNCVTTTYYQCGPGNIHLSCLIELLINLMEEPVFDTLRTKEQLGYDVSAGYRDTYGILAFSITVVSQINKMTVDHVESRIQAFLNGFVSVLKSMSPAEFDQRVQALIKLKQGADMDLGEEFKRNWEEIRNSEYVFDRIERKVAILSQITKNEVIEFFLTQIGKKKSTPKVLTVQVVGHEEGSKEKYPIEDPSPPASVDYVMSQVENNDVSDRSFVQNIPSYPTKLSLYPANYLTS